MTRGHPRRKRPAMFLRSERDGCLTIFGWIWLASVGRTRCYHTVTNPLVHREFPLTESTVAQVQRKGIPSLACSCANFSRVKSCASMRVWKPFGCHFYSSANKSCYRGKKRSVDAQYEQGSSFNCRVGSKIQMLWKWCRRDLFQV